MSLKEQMISNSVGQKVRVKDLMENKPLISDPTASLLLAEKIVKKLYLNDLERYKVSKPSRSVLELSTDRNVKMFKISGLVFDNDENILDRLNNVYSSMHGLGLSIVFMLKSDGISIELYMGPKSVEEDFTENTYQEELAIIHADCLEEAQKIREELLSLYPKLKPDLVIITSLGPTIASHVGPDFIGIAYRGKKREA